MPVRAGRKNSVQHGETLVNIENDRNTQDKIKNTLQNKLLLKKKNVGRKLIFIQIRRVFNNSGRRVLDVPK